MGIFSKCSEERNAIVCTVTVLELLVGCDRPTLLAGEPENGTETQGGDLTGSDPLEGSSSGADAGSDGESTTGADDGDPGPRLDVGAEPPPPVDCPDGAGDLELVWSNQVNDAERADAVGVGDGLVAWTVGDFRNTELRVVDPNGDPLWSPIPHDIVPGEGSLSNQAIAITEDGDVVLAAMVSVSGGYDAVVLWYDANGELVGSDTFDGPSFDDWRGVVALPGGDVVVAGAGGEDLLVRRYSPGALEVWTRTYDGPGQVWASDVDVTPSGRVVVSGHSNAIPGPVLRAYGLDGELAWDHLAPEIDDSGGTGGLEIAYNVANDRLSRSWMTVESDLLDADRVELFDAAGALVSEFSLDFNPIAIDVAPNGNIVVGGVDYREDMVFVETRTPQWDLVGRYERTGRFLLDMSVDHDCHTYVTITSSAGSELQKLR